MPLTNEQNAALTKWSQAKNTLDAMRAQALPLVEEEKKLRLEVMRLIFPGADEGTSKLDLGGGWTLKAINYIERKTDEAAVHSMCDYLKVNITQLFRLVHEVDMKAYRALTDEQRKVVDTALVLKPRLPTLELVGPASMPEGK